MQEAATDILKKKRGVESIGEIFRPLARFLFMALWHHIIPAFGDASDSRLVSSYVQIHALRICSMFSF